MPWLIFIAGSAVAAGLGAAIAYYDKEGKDRMNRRLKDMEERKREHDNFWDNHTDEGWNDAGGK